MAGLLRDLDDAPPFGGIATDTGTFEQSSNCLEGQN
jgi:hypothetical protein